MSYLVLIVAFLLPLMAEDHSPVLSSMLFFIFCAIYLVFISITKNMDLFCAMPILFSGVYYNILIFLGIPPSGLGSCFIPPGLLAMVIVLISLPKGGSLIRTFYFSWFFLTAVSLTISIYALFPYRMLNLLNFTIWAASYLLGSEFIRDKQADAIIETRG